MTTFVYPWYNQNEHCERELRMSLRSLKDNVLVPYNVAVVGDCPVRLADLIYIEHHREAGTDHAKCLDAARKLQLVCNTPHVTDHFVYMADDLALLLPFSPGDVALPIALEEVGENPRMDTLNDALMIRTVNALRSRGLQRVWNYETHMPRLFSKRRMQEILEVYQPGENRLMIPTLYFNHFWPNEQPVVLNKMDGWMARFNGKEGFSSFGPQPNTAAYLRCMLGKRFLNYNDAGRTQPLVDAMLRLWPEKSTHETSTKAYVVS